MKSASRLGILLTLTSLLSAGASAVDLEPGKKAPALKIAEWVKGKEVKSFQAGKVYVVEFWATWCGPCIAGMPHLSELQAKFKDKVTIIGVNAFERPDGDVPAKVKTFVAEQGNKMAYTVARDTDAGDMAKTWMAAAGQNGIPAAFIVNQKGVVVWIGHPAMMDEPLQQVVDGTFDVAKSKADFAEQANANEKRLAVGKRLNELEAMYRAGQKEDALKGFDEVVANDPAQKSGVEFRKVLLFLDGDFAKAAEVIRAQMKADGDGNALNIMLLNFVIRNHKVQPADASDYDSLREEVILHLESHSPQDDYMLPLSLATGYTHMKKFDKALAMLEKGLKKFDATDPSKKSADHRKYYTDQIEVVKGYQAQAGG